MIFPYRQGPCTRDCKDRCIEPNCHMTCKPYLDWQEKIRVQREAATEDAKDSMAKRIRIVQTKKASGFYG